jgi:ABC-type nitrate/sulfonate/bicarbonate transport system substrate-binding protein
MKKHYFIAKTGKNIYTFLLVFFVINTFLLVFFAGCNSQSNTESPLRLGWQPPWANQGQIVEVFKHTNVLQKHNVELEYKGFTYGGPMTEAALAGEIDILFAGDQPGITLISRDSTWKIVARMVKYRSAFVVPPNSTLETLDDLKGKTIATAFGSTTHRDAARILSDKSFEIGTDIKLLHLDQAEHAAVMAKVGDDSWGGIDAIATYDPTIAIVVDKGLAKILHHWISPGVVVVNERLLKNREEDIKNFLKAYQEAYFIYTQDPHHFNSLYSKDSRLPLSDKIYKEIASSEPNMSVSNESEVSILLKSSDQDMLQRNANKALELGIISKSLKITDFIDLSLVK